MLVDLVMFFFMRIKKNYDKKKKKKFVLVPGSLGPSVTNFFEFC